MTGYASIIGGNPTETLPISSVGSALNAYYRIEAADVFIDRFASSGDSIIDAIGNTNPVRVELGSGTDTIFTGSGSDSIWAGAGNDSLLGGAGDDSLYGQDGDDYLVGGSGADLLMGGAGDDTLFGGSGGDVFAFDNGFGQDVISDFGPGDRINLAADLNNTGIATAADLVTNGMVTGGTTAAGTKFTVITIGSDTITLERVDHNDFINQIGTWVKVG